MKKQIENTIVTLTLTLGLICLLPVFAQTNQMSGAAGSNSTKVDEKTNTTQASASASPIKTFSANGDISSLIFVTQKPINATINSAGLSNATKFVLSGDWNLTVSAGKVTNFAAKFIKVLNDSSKWHTHDIINFKPSNTNNTIVQLSPAKSASIPGTVDIKLNNTSIWNNVKTNILISKGKVITINLDNKATSNHFQGQPIYGVVESIKDRNGNELLKAQQQALQQKPK
jgi:ABC-type cobalt transport system substrate-binding protein